MAEQAKDDYDLGDDFLDTSGVGNAAPAAKPKVSNAEASAGDPFADDEDDAGSGDKQVLSFDDLLNATDLSVRALLIVRCAYCRNKLLLAPFRC